MDVRPRGRAVLPPPLLRPPARSQRRLRRRCARRSASSSASGWPRASPGSASTPCRSCSRPPARSTRWSSTPTTTSATCAPSSRAAAGDAVLLGEVNLPADEQRRFFGDEDGDELHLLFDFLGMQATCLALAREDARPLDRRHSPAPGRSPHEAAWASFLRNHDELTLDKLTDARARTRCSPRSGPTPTCSSTGGASAGGSRDARRRPAVDPHGLQPDVLPPRHPHAVLRRGDRDGARTSTSTDRLAVRTPMQWTGDAAGRVLHAPPDALVRPLPSGRAVRAR